MDGLFSQKYLSFAGNARQFCVGACIPVSILFASNFLACESVVMRRQVKLGQKGVYYPATDIADAVSAGLVRKQIPQFALIFATPCHFSSISFVRETNDEKGLIV